METFVLGVMSWVDRRQNPAWRLIARLAAGLQTRMNSSGFARRFSVMLFGTVLGQALSVILSPILTRIYTPEEFGSLSVYMSMLSILAVIAAMRYEIPMAAAKDETEVINLLAISLCALVFTTIALALATILLPAGTFGMSGMKEFPGFRLLLVIGFVLLGLYFIMLYFTTWAQEFRAIARTRISQGVSGPISQIVFGLLGLGSGGLAAGFAIGQSSGTFLLITRVLWPRAAMLRKISWRAMRRTAWDHRNFPLISSWAGLVDSAGSGQVIYLLLAALYPGPVAGYLFISERIVARPLQMVSTSLLTVFMGEIGQTVHTRPDMLKRRFLQVTSRQFMVALAWVVIIDIISYLAFPLLFGAKWTQAVPFILVMSAVYLMVSVVASVTHTLQVLRRQTLAASWQVGRVAAVCLGFWASSRADFSVLSAVEVYAAIQFVSCSIILVLMKGAIDQLCRQHAEAL